MSIWLLNHPELRKVEGKLFFFPHACISPLNERAAQTCASYGGRKKAAQWSFLLTGLAAQRATSKPKQEPPAPWLPVTPHGGWLQLRATEFQRHLRRASAGHTPFETPSHTYPSNRTSVLQSFQILMSSPEVCFKRSEAFLFLLC